MSRSTEQDQPLVLVVDDDRVTAMVLSGILRNAGFGTLEAGDHGATIDAVQNNKIHLVLLDVHLPDGDTFDLCTETLVPLGIPVLFISANEDVDTKVRGFAAGGVDYITKPLAGAEVVARVRTHLRLRAALESLARLEAERIERLANTQQSIMPLPKDLPLASFDVFLEQAQGAGGDFYDVLTLGSHIHDYVVADASGHDLGVALWTASFKTLLLEYATIINTPLEVFRIINNSLRRILPSHMYFTSVYARVNRQTRVLDVVNAGHPAPVFIRAATGHAEFLELDGDLIGMFGDANFAHIQMTFNPGDRLVLYSDGLVEARGSREAGMNTLLDACKSLAGMSGSAIIKHIMGVINLPADPSDDRVLMVVEL